MHGGALHRRRVQRTVGLHIVQSARVTPLMALVMMAGTGAMSGAALANGRAINRRTLAGIVKGWLISPVSGFALCYITYRLLEGL